MISFLESSEFKQNEIIGKDYNITKHRDMKKDFFDELWLRISNKKIWTGEIKNNNKKNEEYYTSTIIVPILDSNENILEYLSFSC